MSRRRSHRRELHCEQERISLCEMLDRVLNKGVILDGEAVISVADVDLLYLHLSLLLCPAGLAAGAGEAVKLSARNMTEAR